ncbi:MAG TPA: TonB family protein [Polyangia bacterium]|jgi:TonB family C-terminal domain|nr:TonB family protein [Polyangia bacterium]
MGIRRKKRPNGHLGRGLLASLLLHAQIILPLVILASIYGGRESNEVDLSFESVKENELPAGLPTVEEPVQPEKRPSEKKTQKVAQKEPEPEIEVPPPEKLPPVPKPPEKPLAQLPPAKPQEPPQPPPEQPHQKIVELDMGKDVEAPENARYLADKNNRTENETRARETNLEREQAGQQAQPADQEDKIAGLEDRAARPEKRAGQAGERVLPESFRSEAPGKATLSMRSPRQSVEPEALSPDGMRFVPDEERRMSRSTDGGPGARLRLTRRQYESLFGTDAESAAALAKAQRSLRKGKSAERRERVRSALENFIAEVKPGNQTALNTRAAPFAQFITRMHRKIHELWAFGFMAGLDSKPSNLPLNDPSLMAKLEIVLDGQGNVDRVAVVRSSGLTIYDSAAIDVVYSAAPYPTPPPTILSGNGKVYIHWTFHRNEEACGTAGVDYFILNNGPKTPEKTAPASGKNAG